jgi:dipeptidyl aminopeptidase/acylaminoacyl peptidase
MGNRSMRINAVSLKGGIWFLFTIVFSVLSTHAQVPGVTRRYDQVAISPDGTHVAWVEQGLNAQGDPSTGTSIYVQALDGADKAPGRIVPGGLSSANAESVAWSPDSRHLAFLSDASGRPQLHIVDLDTGKTRKLTDLTGAFSLPAWSPDGRSIAFLFTDGATGAAGPLSPMSAETGVIDAKISEQRLAVLDLATGNIRQLSPRDTYVYEFDWAPDSKNIVLTAAHGAGDANWYVARLYKINVGDGTLTELYKPPLQIAVPHWSPDGEKIAFIGGLMSDEGFVGGDIFVIPASGGEAHNITPGIAASPAALYWTGPNTIAFIEYIDGEYGIASLNITNRKVDQRWTGADVTSSATMGLPDISLSANGNVSAVVRDSWLHAPDIWVGPVGQWGQLTHANDAAHPAWGEVKSLHWMNGETRVQGWLMYPSDYDPQKRYPMMVWVHGGPAGSSHIGWPEVFMNPYELSAHGYFVFYPNPRGSFGAGEKFTQGNVKDFGYGDFRDILTGLDEIVKTLPVDNDRIGISGWSYGGYMTMWAVTQTNRFRAAVAGAGLADWESYYGENDIDEWMIPYFGASAYDDPAVYARSAPMTFIKKVTTPTLILVGERDGECPAPQSREFWHALKTLGVDTELVIYAGEGHVFFQPDDRRDAMDRLIAWFDHYLKSKT